MKLPSRLTEKADAASRLGLGWAAFRVRYAVEHKLGRPEKRSPAQPDWPTGPTLAPIPMVDCNSLRQWLADNYGDDDIERLLASVENLQDRKFNVFGQAVFLDSWLTDPVSGHTYPAVHWSKVPHRAGTDVKQVWEPSRFTWAYDLARLHLLQQQGAVEFETAASDVMFDLFDSWLAENPPNTGINWDCGQESSLRLMSVVLVHDAMRDSLTDQRLSKLNVFAEATGLRIEANIAYARSQQNNHWTSEACGLILVGALFPHLADSGRLLRTGLTEMVAACEALVLPDGGTSQYSTNYHRVFCHAITLAIAALVAANQPVPHEISSALVRATSFMDAVTTVPHGHFPLIGADDGANILPLAQGDYNDGRTTLAMGEAVANDTQILPPGPWDQACLWLGAKPTKRRDRQTKGGIRSFPDAGFFVLSAGDFTVFVRAARFAFRPSHADQMHIDVWHRGKPVATDSGTASYNPADPTEPEYGDSAWHNTITESGENHMPRVGRFLFANWLDAYVTTKSVQGVHLAIVTMGQFHRTVQVSEAGVTVFDSSETDGASTRIHLVLEQLGQAISGETVRVPTAYGSTSWTERVRLTAELPATTEILATADGLTARVFTNT